MYNLNKKKKGIIKFSENGDLTRVQRCLQKNPGCVDNLDDNGDTPLVLVAAFGYLDILKVLIEYKADVNVQNQCGSTALMAAASNCKTDSVNMLIEHNADVNRKDCDDRTALMCAALEGCVDIVNVLIDHNAGVDVQNYNGSTALLRAAISGHVDIIKRLIDQDADINVKNYNGRFPLSSILKSEMPSIEKHSIVLKLNLKTRLNLLMFLYGCDFCSLQGTASSNAHRYIDINNVVKCFEFHYWVRSLLEYIYVVDEQNIITALEDDSDEEDDDDDEGEVLTVYLEEDDGNNDDSGSEEEDFGLNDCNDNGSQL